MSDLSPPPQPRFGPGLLVAAAFIGPGTVTTATLAGARFGTALLWAVLLAGASGDAALAQSRSERIGEVRISAELAPDGSMRVVEDREFVYDGQYFGAFYELPLRDGQSVTLNALTDEQGTTYQPGTASPTASSSPARTRSTTTAVPSRSRGAGTRRRPTRREPSPSTTPLPGRASVTPTAPSCTGSSWVLDGTSPRRRSWRTCDFPRLTTCSSGRTAHSPVRSTRWNPAPCG